MFIVKSNIAEKKREQTIKESQRYNKKIVKIMRKILKKKRMKEIQEKRVNEKKKEEKC